MAINKNYNFGRERVMFKKTAIAALVMGLSGGASAAMYAPAPAPSCAAGNVTVPCEKMAWDLGVDALYIRAEDSQVTAADLNNFRPKSGFGVRVEGSYHFGTGNDVSINWAHYNKDSGTTGSKVTFRSKFDTLNFEIGQHVDFGENIDVRFQGGMQYIKAREDASNSPEFTDGANLSTRGFGPRTGATIKYDFGNGFGLFGDVNFALLTAKQANVTVSPNTHIRGAALSTDQGVGVSYTHSMAQGDLTARLGWKGMQVNNGNNMGALSWDGMLFGLKWVGNA